MRPAHVYAPDDAELQAAQERIVAVAVAVMASFGKVGDDALHAVRALRSVVHGFATLEAAGGFGLPLDCDESFQRLVTLLGRGLRSGVDFSSFLRGDPIGHTADYAEKRRPSLGQVEVPVYTLAGWANRHVWLAEVQHGLAADRSGDPQE